MRKINNFEKRVIRRALRLVHRKINYTFFYFITVFTQVQIELIKSYLIGKHSVCYIFELFKLTCLEMTFFLPNRKADLCKLTYEILLL